MATDTRGEQELVFRWIKPNPHDPDVAEAWVLPRHVSVWVIIRQMELDDDKAESVAEAYELPVEAVQASMAYYEQHREAIDARIANNQAFFGA